MDHVCAERLTPNLTRMTQQPDAHGELHLSHWLKNQIDTISTSTARRILSRCRSCLRCLHWQRASKPRARANSILRSLSPFSPDGRCLPPCPATSTLQRP
jgi:hypothetical protein